MTSNHPQGKALRKLGAFEKTIDLYMHRNPVRFSVIAEIARPVTKDTYKAAPFVHPGTGTEGARDACEFWPAEPKTTYPFPDRVDGLPATLTISITGDPSTPHAAGANLAKTLDGSLLTAKGEQHTIAASGVNACVNKAVADYLIHLRTPSETAARTL